MSRPPSAALKKGARVAVTATAGFAVGRYVVDDPQTAVYATLTPIALLGLGDVGGSLASRERSYLAALVVAALLTALGTVVSEDTAAAALATGVVAFCVSLASVGGSNVAGLGRALILVMVVSAGIPAPDAALDDRLLGLAIGAIASLAGPLMWPGRADADFRRRLAAVFSALAKYAQSVAEDRPERERERDRVAASEALDAARPYALAVVERPSGPAAVEAAQRLLPSGLRQLEEMLAHVSERWLFSSGRELLREVSEGFARAAAVLDSARGRAPDLGALEASRRRFEEDSETRLSELLRRETDREALAHAFGQGFRLRRFGALSAAVCGQARVAAGIDTALWIPGMGTRKRAPLERIVRLLRVHLTPDSVVVRNAARLAIALAVARALAGAFDLQHGFWVVFATLSVLRARARDTRGSAARALLGTAIGAVIATGLLLAFEAEAGVQVALIPLFVMVAIAGGAVSFVAGQAGFTLLIVAIFNLVAPPHWNTGLIRLEDVGLGALVGLVIGAAAWPRGPAGQLRRALGEAIRDGSRYATDVSRALLGGEDAQARLASRRDDAVGAARRAEDVFMAYLAEAVDKPAALERWSALLERMYRLWYGAGLMSEIERPEHYPCPALSQALRRAVDELEQGYEASAAALVSHAGDPPPATLLPLEDLGGHSLACAQSLAGCSEAGERVAGVRLFGVRAWIVELGRQLTELRSAARAAS